MIKIMSKLWFSLYDRNNYTGSELAFYDPTVLSFTKLVEDNAHVIREELENYLKDNQLQSYFNTTMVEQKHSWKTISLRWWSIKFYKNQQSFPKTTGIIKSIDGLVSASFNMLQAGGKIRPHCGDTNGIYRVHLGLDIPATLPDCGFRVKDEWRNWEEGKVLVFVDANNHEAINLSTKNRFIFSFDVIRPEFSSQKNHICSLVMTSLFLQNRAETFGFLHKTPLWFQQRIGFMLAPLAYIAIRVRNLVFGLLEI